MNTRLKYACCGGFYAYDSDQEVPNLQVAAFEYDKGAVMELEVRSLYTPGDDNLLWLGTKGYAVLGRDFPGILTTAALSHRSHRVHPRSQQ